MDVAAISIFLAEDDPEVRDLLAGALRRDGHRVTELEDGAALLQALSVPEILVPDFEPPDLVITDYRMPRASGLDVLSALHRSRWKIPVVLITAFGSRVVHEDARRLGAAAVLDKPFDLGELRKIVCSIARAAQPVVVGRGDANG